MFTIYNTVFFTYSVFKLTEDTLSLAVWLFIEFASNLVEERRFLNVKLALCATRPNIVSSFFVSWICIRHMASDFEYGSAAWNRHRHYRKIKCNEQLHSVNYTRNKPSYCNIVWKAIYKLGDRIRRGPIFQQKIVQQTCQEHIEIRHNYYFDDIIQYGSIKCFIFLNLKLPTLLVTRYRW